MTNLWPDVTARSLMCTEVVTVSETATLGEAVQMLLDHRITGMPVTDEAGHLVGVISIRDILDHMSENPGSVPSTHDFYVSGPSDDDEDWELDDLGVHSEDSTNVSEVMTAEVFAVGVDDSIVDIANALIEHRVHRLLVTEGDDYVGLVAAMDVIRSLTDAAHDPAAQ